MIEIEASLWSLFPLLVGQWPVEDVLWNGNDLKNRERKWENSRVSTYQLQFLFTICFVVESHKKKNINVSSQIITIMWKKILTCRCCWSTSACPSFSMMRLQTVDLPEAVPPATPKMDKNTMLFLDYWPPLRGAFSRKTRVKCDVPRNRMKSMKILRKFMCNR